MTGPSPLLATEDRVAAVARLGFTDRQAAFLTTVMRHSGVCLQRQFAAFCGRANGHSTREFFARLVTDGVARSYACWRRGGTYYHVHAKPLYRAIGEPDSRNRKLLTIPRVVERLMLLDVVLESSDLRWLGTDREKVAYFVHERGIAPCDLPGRVRGRDAGSIRAGFSGAMPIGIGPGDEVVFGYFVRTGNGAAVLRFVLHHHTLFERVGRLTLLLVIPGVLAQVAPRLKSAAGCALTDAALHAARPRGRSCPRGGSKTARAACRCAPVGRF